MIKSVSESAAIEGAGHNDPVKAAAAFAADAHAGQRYGGRPYTRHLAAVAGTLRELGLATVELETVAWLHDTLEDTGTHPSDLEARFGPRVRRLVEQLTKPASGQFAAHISSQEKDAFAVKLADRLANVRAIGETAGSQAEHKRRLVKYQLQLAAFVSKATALGGAYLEAVKQLRQALDAAAKRLGTGDTGMPPTAVDCPACSGDAAPTGKVRQDGASGRTFWEMRCACCHQVFDVWKKPPG